MKILKNISVAASILTVAMMSSCSDKGYWEQAPSQDAYSFMSSVYNENLEPGAHEFEITVNRSNNTGDETVNITFTPAETCPGDINVPSQVSFKAGSNTTNLVITIANATPPYTYAGTLTIDGNASYAGNKSLRLNCPVNYVWSSIGTGTFYDGFVMFDSEYEVEILKADGFERYRVLNPYVEFYETVGKEEYAAIDMYGSNGPSYIEFWENAGGTLSFNPWTTGLIYQGNVNDTIDAYPWNAFAEGSGFTGDFDIWYEPGFAVLSPVYYIDGVGGYGQQQYAVQIGLP